MIYAPFLVVTLCRYDLFKRCLESLSANPYAKHTPVYVALDYPFKDEHWDGYNKIKDFLRGDFNFKELNIIKRTTNFGPADNFNDAVEQVFSKYDRVITSEDDVEFSPNFLEYIDKGLEKFENDDDIYAICGFGLPTVCFKSEKFIPCGQNNFLKMGTFYNPWGVGVWKNKYLQVLEVCKTEQCFPTYLFDRNPFVLLKYPKILVYFTEILLANYGFVIDQHIKCYLFSNGKKVILPIVTKTKNLGIYSLEGITSPGTNVYEKYQYYQNLDKEMSFDFVEDENNSSVSKKYESMLHSTYNKPPPTSKKYIFKCVIKYIFIRVFGLKFARKLWKFEHPYSSSGFAKMRSAYLTQKSQKEGENA